ncbi:MAG: hypothetical protein IJU50_10570, partial [Lachnospiraceae bacterium]|nr:hypothetical protein [Lachnospiraceae bacterium]
MRKHTRSCTSKAFAFLLSFALAFGGSGFHAFAAEGGAQAAQEELPAEIEEEMPGEESLLKDAEGEAEEVSKEAAEGNAEEASEEVSEGNAKEGSEESAEGNAEEASEEAMEKNAKDVSEEAAEGNAGKVSEEAAEGDAEKIPEEASEKNPEEVSEDAADDNAEDAADENGEVKPEEEQSGEEAAEVLAEEEQPEAEEAYENASEEAQSTTYAKISYSLHTASLMLDGTPKAVSPVPSEGLVIEQGSVLGSASFTFSFSAEDYLDVRLNDTATKEGVVYDKDANQPFGSWKIEDGILTLTPQGGKIELDNPGARTFFIPAGELPLLARTAPGVAAEKLFFQEQFEITCTVSSIAEKLRSGTVFLGRESGENTVSLLADGVSALPSGIGFKVDASSDWNIGNGESIPLITDFTIAAASAASQPAYTAMVSAAAPAGYGRIIAYAG